MTSLLNQARSEAVSEIAKAIIGACSHALLRHGEDPESIPILAAGIVSALETMDRVSPRIRMLVFALLQEKD